MKWYNSSQWNIYEEDHPACDFELIESFSDLHIISWSIRWIMEDWDWVDKLQFSFERKIMSSRRQERFHTHKWMLVKKSMCCKRHIMYWFAEVLTKYYINRVVGNHWYIDFCYLTRKIGGSILHEVIVYVWHGSHLRVRVRDQVWIFLYSRGLEIGFS